MEEGSIKRHHPLLMRRCNLGKPLYQTLLKTYCSLVWISCLCFHNLSDNCFWIGQLEPIQYKRWRRQFLVSNQSCNHLQNWLQRLMKDHTREFQKPSGAACTHQSFDLHKFLAAYVRNITISIWSRSTNQKWRLDWLHPQAQNNQSEIKNTLSLDDLNRQANGLKAVQRMYTDSTTN